jgi:hypothetical protein
VGGERGPDGRRPRAGKLTPTQTLTQTQTKRKMKDDEDVAPITLLMRQYYNNPFKQPFKEATGEKGALPK